MTALDPRTGQASLRSGYRFQLAYVQDLVKAGRVDAESLLTPDEVSASHAVRRYNILDTPPGEAFDRIAYLARRLLDVPIALIAVVDADREWFKSRQGIEIERDSTVTSPSAPPRSRPNAPHHRRGRPIRDDVRRQPDRALRAPTSTDSPPYRLRTHDGHAIGTICVFDPRPRVLTPTELHDLEQLAAVVMRELDLRLASRRALFNT